jgi:hypothetical protein
MATQGWKVSVTSLHSLFEHWLHCHELFEQDRKYLKYVYELRYEDYVENPGKYHEDIAVFLGTRVPEPPKEDKFRYVTQWPDPGGLRVPERFMEETSGVHNKKYLDRWHNLLANSPLKAYYRYIARKYEARFAQYDYSLIQGLGIDEELLQGGGRFAEAFGAVCGAGADTGALLRRLATKAPWSIKQRIKAVLPEFVLAKIRRIREQRSRRAKHSGTKTKVRGQMPPSGFDSSPASGLEGPAASGCVELTSRREDGSQRAEGGNAENPRLHSD